MRTIAVGLGCCLLAGVVWVLLGSRISLVADRDFAEVPSPETATPLVICSDSFAIGSRKWPLGLKVALDARGRVVISADGRQFALGPARKRWADPVAPQYLFVPDDGDVVSFTRQEGRVEWWTPFAFSVMGGETPRWHRWRYARLRWAKRTGGLLEITWRDVQDRYRSGWMDTYAARLAKVRVQ